MLGLSGHDKSQDGLDTYDDAIGLYMDKIN